MTVGPVEMCRADGRTMELRDGGYSQGAHVAAAQVWTAALPFAVTATPTCCVDEAGRPTRPMARILDLTSH